MRLTGCIGLPNDPQGRMVIKPITFLGGTVLSFNASLGVGPTQESTLSVDIINDCAASGYLSGIAPDDPQGDFFYGYVKIGAPVFFSVCEAMGLSSGSPGCFEFGGILTNYTATQSSSGRTFNAKIVDPRVLLENSVVVVSNHITGPIKHRNYFNVFAYYEQNILPEELKPEQPDDLLLELSPGFPDYNEPISPTGDNTQSDCEVFGLSNSTSTGMSYRQIYQALNKMKPLIYSPNYGEPYNPELTGRDLAIAGQKLYHEDNVFQLDLTGFPDPPPYFRVAGPSVTILQLLTMVCDALGLEFIVTLERSDDYPDSPHRIVIQTKKIEKGDFSESIRDNILYYDGKSIDFSYGKELRLDKSRTILLGEQKHDLYESSVIDYFFGEDKDGNPITAYVDPNYSGCGFVIDIEVDELNSTLTCPLFDPETQDVVSRKVQITEEDIRCALSSENLWSTRALSSGIVGDFNKIIRYNFPEKTNELVRDNLRKLTRALPASGEFVEENQGRKFVDAMKLANDRYAIANRRNSSEELSKVHAFISNIGKTYYGKQYLVSLQDENDTLKVYALPAGIYDENYFGLSTGVFIDPGIGVTGCTDITIPEGKIYRGEIYSHEPTNAGGWVDPCVRVLGINDEGYKLSGINYPEASLSFFREEDDRVGAFARFDTSEVEIQYKGAFIKGSGNPDSGKGEDEIEYVEGSFIASASGQIDVSLFDFDEYLIVRPSGGYCEEPSYAVDSQPYDGPADTGTITATDRPSTVWVRTEVSEKIYLISNSGSGISGSGTESEYPACNRIPKVVIKFNNPILKRAFSDQTNFAETILYTAQALSVSEQLIDASGQEVAISGLEAIRESQSICGIPSESGAKILQNAQSAVDNSSSNSTGYHPAAGRPSRVVIPLKSNIETYGPWYSPNFDTSTGGIDLQQDSDLAPWNYGSIALMDEVGTKLVKDSQSTASEFETGSVNYPYWPELKLGFLENGPNLTNISVTYGANGINTNYTWQTYTPKFGNLKNLENQQMKESTKNKIRAQKIIKQRQLRENRIDAKVKKSTVGGSKPKTADKPSVQNEASLHRILIGEMYDFSVIRDNENPVSGEITGSGQVTTVGSETLYKSVLELRYDYHKKAFMSWDGLLGPVSVSGDGGLPMFAKFAKYEPNNSGNAVSCPIAPYPPILLSNSGHALDVEINRDYLNPLTNVFNSGEHHHDGKGAGHCIDIVGRNEYENSDTSKEKPYIPGKGIMNSFYGQTEWDRRYSDDYRFLGLRGPLVLHSWGYDTQGKPIPNAVDDVEDIRESGIFAVSGLKDEFYQDWLQKPATWPVAPVDLRFDRERGVWISPPQHKIVVAKATQDIDAYSAGSGILINEYDGQKYGQQIYDGSGNLINGNDDLSQAKIEIEDRIGVSIKEGDKGYAYFDSFSSKYLLLGGGGGSNIYIGRFMNQWPSLNNVKEPMNAVKDVHLYKSSNECPDVAVDGYDDKTFCPWFLKPETEPNESGVLVPKVVKAINILANVAAAEYQAKWCMITKIDNNYYLLAAEC